MKTFISAALLSSTLYLPTANAAFIPTDGSVDFLYFFGDENALLGIFDNEDTSFEGGYLSISTDDNVSFTFLDPDYELTSYTGGSFTLTGSSAFLIAAYDGTEWLAPTSIVCNELNRCSLSWSGLVNELVLDIAEEESSPVPVPASVWLFGSGLLGMTAVARRRNFSPMPNAVPVAS